jgi:hypothetical protein
LIFIQLTHRIYTISDDPLTERDDLLTSWDDSLTKKDDLLTKKDDLPTKKDDLLIKSVIFTFKFNELNKPTVVIYKNYNYL